MPKRHSSYHESLLEDLQDPVEAAMYLNASMEEDAPEAFLVALRNVAEARQMSRVAERAGVSRESLYRMLRPSGNPRYKNLIGIIKAIGLEFGGVRSPIWSSQDSAGTRPSIGLKKIELKIGSSQIEAQSSLDASNNRKSPQQQGVEAFRANIVEPAIAEGSFVSPLINNLAA